MSRARLLLLGPLVLVLVVVVLLKTSDDPDVVPIEQPPGDVTEAMEGFDVASPLVPGDPEAPALEPPSPSERRAEPVPAGAEAPAAADAAERAEPPVVDLRVVRADPVAGDVPVPGLRIVTTESVNLAPEQGVLLGTTDADGELFAELARPGVHVFHPEPGSLPPEVVAPSDLHQDRILGTSGENGAHEFAPGETAAVTLTLPSAGTLVVTVRDADGEPVPHAGVEAWVRLEPDPKSSLWMRPDRGEVARTDERGVAVLGSLPAGLLSVRLRDMEALRDTGLVPVKGPGPPAPGGFAARPATEPPVPPPAEPAPKRVELAPGGRAHVTLTLGAGEHALRGRVVDEVGEPLERAIVSAYYDRRAPGVPAPERSRFLRPPAHATTVVTDAAGRFALERLDGGPYLVYVDVNPVLQAASGPRLMHPEEVCILVPAGGDSGPIALGDITVPRPKVFVVKGRVVLTQERIGKRKLRLSRVRPTIGGEVAECRECNLPYAGCTFDSRTGEFEAACRLPLDTLVLRLGERLGEEHVREYEFVPEAGVVLEDVELRYP